MLKKLKKLPVLIQMCSVVLYTSCGKSITINTGKDSDEIKRKKIKSEVIEKLFHLEQNLRSRGIILSDGNYQSYILTMDRLLNKLSKYDLLEIKSDIEKYLIEGRNVFQRYSRKKYRWKGRTSTKSKFNTAKKFYTYINEKIVTLFPNIIVKEEDPHTPKEKPLKPHEIQEILTRFYDSLERLKNEDRIWIIRYRRGRMGLHLPKRFDRLSTNEREEVKNKLMLFVEQQTIILKNKNVDAFIEEKKILETFKTYIEKLSLN